MEYAKATEKEAASCVMEVKMGMIDRGADLSWLSQYPDEREITFPPYTGLEVLGTRDNVELAEFAFLEVQRSAEELWARHREARGLRGNRHRRAFIEGVVCGFGEVGKHLLLALLGDRAVDLEKIVHPGTGGFVGEHDLAPRVGDGTLERLEDLLVVVGQPHGVAAHAGMGVIQSALDRGDRERAQSVERAERLHADLREFGGAGQPLQ